LKPPATKTLRVALAGNPNTGKSTLFNRLTGGQARVANYPGLTVEREIGRLALPKAGTIELLDVPGTYSLSARSAEERIAIESIAGLAAEPVPDAVLLVADATQLTRNLYLALQVIELQVPLVVALNMVDLLPERDLEVRAAELSRRLGVPVVPISAKSDRQFSELLARLDDVLETPGLGVSSADWLPNEGALAADMAAVVEVLPEAWRRGPAGRHRALALWALISWEESESHQDLPDALQAGVRDRQRWARAAGRDLEQEIVGLRYAWIDAAAPGFLRSPTTRPITRTDRLDRILLHPVAGFALFLLAMGVVFQSLFSWSDPAIGAIEQLFSAIGGALERALPAGLFTEFLTKGVVEGVGSVLVFLPQILLLFFFLSVMEDTGYLARVAVLMDRVMKLIGLHGRAFVPMLSGYACAVPAVLATRTMERRRDRLLTMLVVPLMTCSARLPVYTLLIAALFPPERLFGWLPVQGLLMVAMYLFSTCAALVVAGVLGRVVLRGPRVPLLAELPPYRSPHWPSVLSMMWKRSRLFVTEAGGVILVCTILMWAALSFPRPSAIPAASGTAESVAAAPSALAGSYASRFGRAIEPLIEPLGFDWKIGVGLVGAFAAREVFVSTMGLVYGLGEDQDEASLGLREHIRTEMHADGRPVYTPLVGLSLMIFFAIACQCMSTLAVVRRESGSWRWPAFLFVYTFALAWLSSFAVYQGGRALGLM
jgi:ferrous iron transport protein B